MQNIYISKSMGKDIKKMSKYQAGLYLRDQKILELRRKLLEEGYQICVANEIIVRKLKLKSVFPIYAALKKAKSDGNMDDDKGVR